MDVKVDSHELMLGNSIGPGARRQKKGAEKAAALPAPYVRSRLRRLSVGRVLWEDDGLGRHLFGRFVTGVLGQERDLEALVRQLVELLADDPDTSESGSPPWDTGPEQLTLA